MKTCLIVGLLVFVGTQDAEVAELIRRLDAEHAGDREAASASLRRLGMRAVPELERALGHSSAEVRARAAAILGGLPQYALSCVLNHPEFPAVRRLWNGIIDALIAKQPIPEALWKEFGREEKEAQEVRPNYGPPAAHGGAWILARLREEGARALNILARSYGIAGKHGEPAAQSSEDSGRLRPLPATLASRLLDIGVDETTFEEIYGTILMMHEHLLALWMGSLTDEGWDVVLRVLVRLRRKGEAKPMSPPAGREEALSLALRGPWNRGIASALGRAFAAEKEGGKLFASRLQDVGAISVNEADHPGALAAIYHKMVLLDKTMGMVYFTPEFLETRPAQLPNPRYLSTMDRDVLMNIPGQAEMDKETRCVVETIVATMDLFAESLHKSSLDKKYDPIMLRLIPGVAKHVVEAARR